MKHRYYIVGFLVLAVLYFVLGSIDGKALSHVRFVDPDPAPASDEDNVYFGLVAATNALHRCDAGIRYRGALFEKVADANAEVVAAFLQASRRSVWRGPRDGSDDFIPVSGSEYWLIARLCKELGRCQVLRGEVGAALETARCFLALGRKMSHDAEGFPVWDYAMGVLDNGCWLATQIAMSGEATPEELRALLGVLRETDAATLRENLRRMLKNAVAYRRLALRDGPLR